MRRRWWHTATSSCAGSDASRHLRHHNDGDEFELDHTAGRHQSEPHRAVMESFSECREACAAE